MVRKIVKIPLDEDEARQLEAACYEAKARKDMLTFMIEHGIDPNNQTFVECKEECVRYSIEWAKAQDKLERDHLQDYNQRYRWWLQPGTNEIYLEIDQ